MPKPPGDKKAAKAKRAVPADKAAKAKRADAAAKARRADAADTAMHATPAEKPAKAKRAAPAKKALRKVPKAVRKAEKRVLAPFSVGGAAATVLDALWQTVEARRLSGDVATSHSARLLARGTPKVAQKLGEEAVECVIEATLGNRAATILESADLLYHLVVVWVDAGIRPEDVWTELARRQGISGVVEKASRPAGLLAAAGTAKLP